MEFGEIRFKQDQIEKGDLDLRLSGAFIINAQLGSLIALRSEMQKLFGRDIIFYTLSSQLLYVVSWNDLSEEKKSRMKGNFYGRER